MTQALIGPSTSSRVPRTIGAETAAVEAVFDDLLLDQVFAPAGCGRAAVRDDDWMVAIADDWPLPFVASGADHVRVAAVPLGYGGLSLGEDVDALLATMPEET